MNLKEFKQVKSKGGDKKVMKIKFKQEKGITLIALVVTIVVLLILAGVSINAVYGQDGIIEKAKDAQNKMDQATQNDLDSIDGLSNWIDSQINGTTGVRVVGKEGSLLAMYQKAQKETCDNADGACKDATHLHIGDYVDYKNPTSGTAKVTSAESGVYGKDSNGNATVNINQTYTLSTTKNNVKWRVLGIDSETGGIKLIAADPIERDANADLLTAVNKTEENPYLYLKGAEAYLYGPDAMDKVSEMYLNSTYATKARSATMDDINEITGVTTEEKIKEVDLLGYGTEYNFEKQYTPELWLQIGKKKDETKAGPVKGTSTSYAYYINVTEEGVPTVTIANTRVHDMLFKNVEFGTQKAYWLASRGVFADSSRAYFGSGIVASGDAGTLADVGYYAFNSDGFEHVYGLAVRPVVSLKSDVMAEAMPKIADPT